MNFYPIRAIYKAEIARVRRTLLQSIVSPVISTSLYFVVFGAAIGSRISEVEGVSYGAFIVPGLIMLMLLTQSVSNASFGIFFPSFPAAFTSCSRRRSRIWKSSLATWVRRLPNPSCWG